MMDILALMLVIGVVLVLMAVTISVYLWWIDREEE